MLQQVSTLVLVALTGCMEEERSNATLAELPDVGVSLQLWQGEDRVPTKGFASVSYDEDAFLAANGGQCATVGGLDVTFPNATVLDVSAGGGGDLGCSYPQFSFELADFQVATSATLAITIADASSTIAATYADLEPRRATLRGGTEWRFTANQVVTLGWSHPQDLVDGAQFTPMTFRTQVGAGFDIPATFAGDEITLAFPASLDATGPGSLVTRFGYEVGDATACSGAARCTYSLEAGYAHSAVVE